MQIKMTNGDGILLKAWTNILRNETELEPIPGEYFIYEDIYIRIKDNHLIISNNRWKPLKLKKNIYGKIRNDYDKEQKKVITAKTEKVDMISINLNNIDFDKKQMKKRNKKKK